MTCRPEKYFGTVPCVYDTCLQKLSENEDQKLFFKVINGKAFKKTKKKVTCTSLGLPSQAVYFQDKKVNLTCSLKPRFFKKKLLVSRKHAFKILSSHTVQ